MTRPILWIILGAGALCVVAAVTITVTITHNSNKAQEAIPPVPSNLAEQERRADEERAKVMKGMYDHKKSTTPLHDVFSSDEATTTQSK